VSYSEDGNRDRRAIPRLIPRPWASTSAGCAWTGTCRSDTRRRRSAAIRPRFCHWEKGHAAPELRFLPAILRFLGYDPRPEPATFGGRIQAAREAQGLSARELARRLGLDPGTLAAWETDAVPRFRPRIQRVFERYLARVSGSVAEKERDRLPV